MVIIISNLKMFRTECGSLIESERFGYYVHFHEREKESSCLAEQCY